MRSLQPPEQRLLEALVQADPELRALAAESRDETGQFLEYPYLGMVAHQVVMLCRDEPDMARLDRIFAALEDALNGDEHVTNLIGVGFLEHLKALDALDVVRERFGPKLSFWAATI